MKHILSHTLLFVTLITLGTLQGIGTHTFINDSNLPIHVSVLYVAGTHTDKARIEPHTKRTFELGGILEIKRIDVRDANKNKMILQTRPSGAPVSTRWSFTIENNKGLLTRLDGSMTTPTGTVKCQEDKPILVNGKNACTVEGNLP